MPSSNECWIFAIWWSWKQWNGSLSWKSKHFCKIILILYHLHWWQFFCLFFQASFDTFTHYKSIFIRDLGFIGEKAGALRYPPYKDSTLKLMSNLLKNRKLPNFAWLGYVLSFIAGGLVVATILNLVYWDWIPYT